MMTEPKQAEINLRILRAVSKCATELRSYLMGVCLEIDADGVNYIASDGFVLFAHREPRESGKNDLLGKFIIPTKICRAFELESAPSSMAILSEAPVTVLGIHQMGDTYRRFSPIDEPYPNWRKMFRRPSPSGQGGIVDPRLAWKVTKVAAKISVLGEMIPTITPD